MTSLPSFISPVPSPDYGGSDIRAGIVSLRQGLLQLELEIEDELLQLAKRQVWYPLYEYQKTVRDNGKPMPPLNCCQQEVFRLQDGNKLFKKGTSVTTRHGTFGNYIKYLGSDANWQALSEDSTYKRGLRLALRSRQSLERLKVLKPLLRDVRSRLAALDKSEEALLTLLATAGSVLR